MDTASAREATMVEEVERALAPYRGLVSPPVLEAMRDELLSALREHPVAQRLVKQIAPSAVVQQSGDVATGAEATAEDASAAGASNRRGGS